jgi:hypothetical protein
MSRTTAIGGRLGLIVWLTLAAGCGQYVLEGKVVEGDASAVQAVPPDDPRLEKPGLGQAQIVLTLDPQSLGRERIASSTVQPDGSFAIPVDVFGAGFLEHEFGARARLDGYNAAYDVFMLPGGNQKLLITLAPGRDTYDEPDEALEESKRFLPNR